MSMLGRMPRVALARLPTPVEKLSRLSETLGGPRLFIKRDDCTGLATGGNKTRKLEFLMAEALDKGAAGRDSTCRCIRPTATASQQVHAQRTRAGS